MIRVARDARCRRCPRGARAIAPRVPGPRGVARRSSGGVRGDTMDSSSCCGDARRRKCVDGMYRAPSPGGRPKSARFDACARSAPRSPSGGCDRAWRISSSRGSSCREGNVDAAGVSPRSSFASLSGSDTPRSSRGRERSNASSASDISCGSSARVWRRERSVRASPRGPPRAALARRSDDA